MGKGLCIKFERLELNVTRLFVSLYIVIIFGLLAINWGTEAIWRELQQQPPSSIEQFEKLAATVAITLTKNNQQALAQVAQTGISILNQEDVMWLDWQQAQLASGDVVLTYDERARVSAFVINQQHQLIKVGPASFDEPNQGAKVTLLIMSYVLLGIIVALWIMPLWRDLRRLQLASIDFTKGPIAPQVLVHKDSAIAPVLVTFNQMTAQIARLMEEQKQLANAVSHDIRTPLARLKFSFAMLNEPADTLLPDMRKDVEEIESLIDEMLNYGRLESEAQALNVVDVNITQLLTNHVEKMGRHSDIPIELIIAPALYWRCDGHLLERACQNYITNALRYAQSKVQVTVKIIDSNLVISVDDDGIGVSKQDASQVFKAFARLDKSRNKQSGGFGLGLAIVARIVYWHQGECEVKESVLGGAQFSIKLPKL